jgi:hypothetical protein
LEQAEETHFLRSLSSGRTEEAPTKRRRLSKEKEKQAKEYGLGLLNKRTPPHSIPPGLKFVGDKIVTVLVRDDNGGVAGVTVRRP